MTIDADDVAGQLPDGSVAACILQSMPGIYKAEVIHANALYLNVLTNSVRQVTGSAAVSSVQAPSQQSSNR